MRYLPALSAAAAAVCAAAFVRWRLARRHAPRETEAASLRRALCCEAEEKAELRRRLQEQEHRLRTLEHELQEQLKSSSPETPLPPLHRVVLTGGPCAGKTTALFQLKERLQALGFLVVCVPEIATTLFQGGIPFPTNEAEGYHVQRNLMKLQLATEDAFLNICRTLRRPAVMLCDRGTMDGKAYLSDANWDLLLEELQLTPTNLSYQRYDAILHLVTAADGAEEAYTLSNNTARTEAPDEARRLCQRAMACWTGHEHLYIVDNSSGFDDKIRRAVARVARLVGVPAPLAVSRKFLLKAKPSKEDIRRATQRVEMFEVEQTYLLATEPKTRCRVRRRQQGTNVSFQHQLWRVTEEGQTTLSERTLSAREYASCLKQADPTCLPITKNLMTFCWGRQYWELNAFTGLQNHAILEVEAETATEELEFPPFVEVESEVTNQKAYDSYRIAKQLMQLAAEEAQGIAHAKGVPSMEKGNSNSATLLHSAIENLKRKGSQGDVFSSFIRK